MAEDRTENTASKSAVRMAQQAGEKSGVLPPEAAAGKSGVQSADKSGVLSPLAASDADKSKARQWFKKGNDCRHKREYDYAIECYVTGLGFWPDAVEEGHMPMHSLSVQRAQAGGKKPGMMESMKHSVTAKDAKQAMLNSAWLMAKDPQHIEYVETLLKNAARGGYLETVKFAAPLLFDALKRDRKPNLAKYRTLRQTLLEAGERAELIGNGALYVWLVEHASQIIDYLRARLPDDSEIRNEQRDLSSKLAIARGKYQEAESFRESLQGAEAQKTLHDTDRVMQGEHTRDALLVAARKELQQHPNMPAKVFALADALTKRERAEEETEAIEILERYYHETRNYSFKMRADDVHLRQLTRQTRQYLERARETGSEEDRRNARLAALEQLETEMSVAKDRVSNYPTDLRLKFRYGHVLFKAKRYDEAIPLLQAAQSDPRSRLQCELLIGRCFMEKQDYGQAAAVLKETLANNEGALPDDQQKELLYFLAQAYEGHGERESASQTYGRLLRMDYNYAEGAARQRLEKLDKPG